MGRVHITARLVRDVLAAHLPAVAVGSVVPLGAGLDNVAFLVNGELVVRFATGSDAAQRVTREAAVLDAVAVRVPVPVPEPVLTVPERGCLAYTALAGVPLLDVPLAERAPLRVPVAATLGELLAVLHAVPQPEVSHLVEVDDTAPERWLREAAQTWETVAARVPMRHHRPVEALLLAAPQPDPAQAAVFSHHDLGIEHVLVDPATGTVTGVIDWADAAIVDPAFDFGLVLRDLGPDALDAALTRYPSGAGVAGLRERALFYARCSVLEDLEHGVEMGRDASVVKCVDSLGWLFPG